MKLTNEQVLILKHNAGTQGNSDLNEWERDAIESVCDELIQLRDRIRWRKASDELPNNGENNIGEPVEIYADRKFQDADWYLHACYWEFSTGWGSGYSPGYPGLLWRPVYVRNDLDCRKAIEEGISR